MQPFKVVKKKKIDKKRHFRCFCFIQKSSHSWPRRRRPRNYSAVPDSGKSLGIAFISSPSFLKEKVDKYLIMMICVMI